MTAAFSVDGEPRTWDDVIAAARAWGEWPPARSGIGETAFRRRHGLHSADDTKAYLEAWGITVADLRAHLRGERESDWVEGVVSGALRRAGERYAQALAVHRALGGTGRPGAGELDAALAAFAERAAAPERVAALIDEHRLDWTAVELQEVVIEEEGAAREVLYGVRDDGTPIAEIAQAAGTAVVRRTATLAELPAIFAGARPGEVVGPLREDGGWRVIAVVARVEPTPENSFARAREALVARALRRETAARVHWSA